MEGRGNAASRWLARLTFTRRCGRGKKYLGRLIGTREQQATALVPALTVPEIRQPQKKVGKLRENSFPGLTSSGNHILPVGLNKSAYWPRE